MRHADHVGMFDVYRPDPPVACPWCAAPVGHWQGKDGPNALLVWQQGTPHPVAQAVDEDARIDPARYAEFSLPERFSILGVCPNDHAPVADCRCVDGVWTEIDLTAEELKVVEAAQRTRLRKWRGY